MPFQKPEIQIPALHERQEAMFKRMDVPMEKAQLLITQIDDLLKDSLNRKSTEIGCLESFIETLPSCKLTGSIGVLCIGEREVTASMVELVSGKASLGISAPVEYTNSVGKQVRLTEEGMTASLFMDSCVRAIKLLIQRCGSSESTAMGIYVSSYLTLQLADEVSGIFLNFHELCPTLCDDPVEGVDIASLLNLGFERSGLNVQVRGLLSEAVSLLLAGEYERASRAPRCLVAAAVDSNVSFAFALADDAKRAFNLNSKIQNVDFSGYRGTRTAKADENFITDFVLPRCGIDSEIDFTECAPGKAEYRRFERVVGGKNMAEMVRRTIVRIFQHKCPESVWKPNSITFKQAISLATTEDEEIIKSICSTVWQWKITAETELIQRCALVVLRRSAFTLACVIAALAKRTGRLQPALGGCSAALQGALGSNPKYQKLIRESLNIIFHKDTSALIQFITVQDASAKGAAILGAIKTSRPSS